MGFGKRLVGGRFGIFWLGGFSMRFNVSILLNVSCFCCSGCSFSPHKLWEYATIGDMVISMAFL